MARNTLLTLSLLFYGFLAFAAPAISIVEYKPQKMFELLSQRMGSPKNQILLQSEVLLEKNGPSLHMPTELHLDIPGDLQIDSQFAVSHAFFTVPVPIEILANGNFWKFSNLANLVKDYTLITAKEMVDGTDGSISIPVGFTFGLAPSSLDCRHQLRFQKNGTGPTGNVHASWAHPEWTVYQLNTDCNMFFKGLLTISSIYRMNDGTASVMSQSFLYVKEDAIQKLMKIRLLAGSPSKVIADKIKDQTKIFVKGLRKLQAPR